MAPTWSCKYLGSMGDLLRLTNSDAAFRQRHGSSAREPVGGASGGALRAFRSGVWGSAAGKERLSCHGRGLVVVVVVRSTGRVPRTHQCLCIQVRYIHAPALAQTAARSPPVSHLRVPSRPIQIIFLLTHLPSLPHAAPDAHPNTLPLSLSQRRASHLLIIPNSPRRIALFAPKLPCGGPRKRLKLWTIRPAVSPQPAFAIHCFLLNPTLGITEDLTPYSLLGAGSPFCIDCLILHWLHQYQAVAAITNSHLLASTRVNRQHRRRDLA